MFCHRNHKGLANKVKLLSNRWVLHVPHLSQRLVWLGPWSKIKQIRVTMPDLAGEECLWKFLPLPSLNSQQRKQGRALRSPIEIAKAVFPTYHYFLLWTAASVNDVIQQQASYSHFPSPSMLLSLHSFWHRQKLNCAMSVLSKVEHHPQLYSMLPSAFWLLASSPVWFFLLEQDQIPLVHKAYSSCPASNLLMSLWSCHHDQDDISEEPDTRTYSQVVLLK